VARANRMLRGDISGNRREIEGSPTPSKETCLDVWWGSSRPGGEDQPGELEGSLLCLRGVPLDRRAALHELGPGDSLVPLRFHAQLGKVKHVPFSYQGMNFSNTEGHRGYDNLRLRAASSSRKLAGNCLQLRP